VTKKKDFVPRYQAPPGTAETSILLRMPAKLRKAIQEAAEEEGVNESEFIRRAAAERAERAK
jgi:uncharacterized protein (DUF1778 family)